MKVMNHTTHDVYVYLIMSGNGAVILVMLEMFVMLEMLIYFVRCIIGNKGVETDVGVHRWMV